MGKKARLKAERKAAGADAPETPQGTAPETSAPSGPVKLVVGFVCVGLLAMFLWSFAYRVDNPSLTETPRQRAAQSGDDHDHEGEGEGGDSMRMITSLMAKLQENPNDVHTLHVLGEQFMRMQQWERAGQLLDRAMSVEPTNTDVLSLSGIVDFNLSKFQSAAEKFEMILELEPDNLMAKYNLGILYGHFLEDKEKAREYLSAVAESSRVDEETRSQAAEELKNLQ